MRREPVRRISRPATLSKGRASARTTVLPEAMRRFLHRRAIDGLGLLLIALSFLYAAALVTYDHRDPSPNHALAGITRNALGTPGAWIGDVFLTTLGLAAGWLVILPAIWGLLVLLRRPLRRWWLRIIGLLAGIVVSTIWLSRLPAWLFVPPGGHLGNAAWEKSSHLASGLLGSAAGFGVVAASFVISLTLLALISGIRLHEWRRGGSGGVAAAGSALRLVSSWRPQGRDAPEIVRPFTDDLIDDLPVEAAPREPSATRGKVIPAGKRPSGRDARQEAKRAREPELLPVDLYTLPPVSLLQMAPASARTPELSQAALQANAEALITVLSDYGIKGDIVRINSGPVVTLYELEPAPGTKSSRVIGLADDIARSLSAVSVRVAVVPGKNVIGIELPNHKRETVYMREMLGSESQGGFRLSLMLGKDIGGQPIVADLARMPHLLVAGTTGSGKSVAVNTMILSLLYRLQPEQCRFIMIDPKMLELSVYDGIPHLLTPVVTEPKKAVVALKWTVREMEDRYRKMSKLGVRNIDGYNARLREAKAAGEVLMRRVQTGFDPDTGKPIFEDQAADDKELPYIVVIVDEFADLMLVAGKDIEVVIQRLAQMARAAGIHLIMATQRPSVDVITGTIKANFPTRISFQVTSKIDSRTILGESGAEQLLGQGDMLYMASGGRITRVHGPFVRDDEVEHVVAFLKTQGAPDYIENITEEDEFSEEDGGSDGSEASGSGDELYDKAVALVARERKASTSFVQRHFQIGYNKAARLIERMEKEGVVSPANHVGKREVLVRRMEEND